VAATALGAFSTKDRERHDDAIALAEVAVHSGTHLDDFPHHLVSHDVARQHGGDEVMKEVKIRAADGAARDLDDRIARILDRRVRNRVAANIFLAVPDESFHRTFLNTFAVPSKSELSRSLGGVPASEAQPSSIAITPAATRRFCVAAGIPEPAATGAGATAIIVVILMTPRPRRAGPLGPTAQPAAAGGGARRSSGAAPTPPRRGGAAALVPTATGGLGVSFRIAEPA